MQAPIRVAPGAPKSCLHKEFAQQLGTTARCQHQPHLTSDVVEKAAHPFLRGLLGRSHNLVKFVRLTPARRRGDPVKAERQKIGRGVVISRGEIDLDEWIRTLAGLLGHLAARNAAARASLAKLLGQSSSSSSPRTRYNG